MIVFQLAFTGIEISALPRKSSRSTQAISSGTGARNSANGPHPASGLTKTIGPHVSTAAASNGSSSLRREPKPLRDGTSRSSPASVHDQRWKGQRSSVKPEPGSSHSCIPRWRQVFWNARSSPSSPRTTRIEMVPIS